MVGVPGRSKGCITCRKRKKKCDLQHPSCANCAKAGFVCGGYERHMIVVHVDETGKGQYKAPLPCKAPVAQFKTPGLDLIAKNLNRSALETECFDAFWDLYLPKSLSNGRMGTKMPNPVIRWARWTQDVTLKDDTMRCALLAVSLTNIGQARKNRAMIEEGMQLYGESLKRVACEIRTPSKMKKSEVMATTRILSLYEQLSDATSAARNWRGHINGLTSLIRMHSPEECSQPRLHEAFIEARYNGILAAIADRKATYLSSPDWTTKPWQGRRKNICDTVIDLLAQLPEIFEEFDIISVPPQSPDLIFRATLLKEKCWDLDRQLQSWYRSYIDCFAYALPPEDLQYMLDGIGAAPQLDLPHILAECGLAALYGMTLYWSCCVLLYGMMKIMYHKFPEQPSIRTEILKSPRMSLRMLCLCIARSLKYFLDPRVGLAAALAICFPISCISQSLPGENLVNPGGCHHPEWREISVLIQQINDKAGIAWTNSFMMHLNEWIKSRGLASISAIPSGEWSLRDIKPC